MLNFKRSATRDFKIEEDQLKEKEEEEEEEEEEEHSQEEENRASEVRFSFN
jgi:hypothetical protein